MEKTFEATVLTHHPRGTGQSALPLALAALVNPRGVVASDSPVLLPLLQVEASPTTGIHQLCPPLFQSQAQLARLPLPIPARPEAAQAAEPSRGLKRELELRGGSGKQSVANSDGWQWRKYGEKLVKGSPNPRSYYKCSHPGCLAKKIVERADTDGAVVSTEYKGDHCHPAPSASKASRFKPKPKEPGGPPATIDVPSAVSIAPVVLGAPLALGSGMLPIPDALRNDFQGMARGGSSIVGDPQEEDTDASDPEPACVLRSAPQDVGPAQQAATAARRLRERALQESPSKRLDALAAYAEEAERQLNSAGNSPEEGPSTKRQRMDTVAGGRAGLPVFGVGGSTEEEEEVAVAPSAPGSSVQRIVDIANLDDGYKWRKYGQKQVKGSPYPRAYYKCTHAGCGVRKHVERSAGDANRFVVTYEGVHNHRAPLLALQRRMKEDEGAADPEDGGEDSSQPTSPHRGSQQQHAASRPHVAPAVARVVVAAGLEGSGGPPPLPGLPVLPGISVPGLPSLPGPGAASMPFLPYGGEALAGVGPGEACGAAGAGGSDVGLSALGLANVGSLADLTNLLRQHAQWDMAVAAQAQSMDAAAAAAGWDPLACLITPRGATVSPPLGAAFPALTSSVGTGKGGRSGLTRHLAVNTEVV